MDEIVVPMSVFTDEGWTIADRDQFLRPDTTMEALANAADALPRGRPGDGRELGRPDGRRNRGAHRVRSRQPPSSVSSRGCGSSASHTPESSRT